MELMAKFTSYCHLGMSLNLRWGELHRMRTFLRLFMEPVPLTIRCLHKLMKPSSNFSKNYILNELQTIEKLCKQPCHENIVGIYQNAQLEGWYVIDMNLCDFNLQQYIYERDTLNGMPMLDMQTMLKIMKDVNRPCLHS